MKPTDIPIRIRSKSDPELIATIEAFRDILRVPKTWPYLNNWFYLSQIAIYGDRRYCEETLKKLLSGLPWMTLRLSREEFIHSPGGVSGRAFDFLYWDNPGFYVIDQDFLDWVDSSPAGSDLLSSISRAARPREKLVIFMTGRIGEIYEKAAFGGFDPYVTTIISASANRPVLEAIFSKTNMNRYFIDSETDHPGSLSECLLRFLKKALTRFITRKKG